MTIPVETPAGSLGVELLLAEKENDGLTVLGYNYPSVFFFMTALGLIGGTAAAATAGAKWPLLILSGATSASLSALAAYKIHEARSKVG